MSKYVCVTGAAGFIGCHLVEALALRGDYVYAVDAMTYAADPARFAKLRNIFAERIELRNVDARTLQRLPDVDAVIHLAASTHVDNSITEAVEFVANNAGTTAYMLELTRAKAQHGMPHFIHISTDEVYGSIAAPDFAREDWTLLPTSPYAASKAAADLLAQTWAKTYNMPVAVLRPTNTYGSGQYPEKLIPKAIRCLQLGRPIPIHGDGSQTRCWLSVHDLVSAILLVLDKRLNGVYNVGGNCEASVRKVVETIRSQWVLDIGAQLSPEYGFIRPACDQRYAVNDLRLRAAGWTPRGNFFAELPQIVAFERERWRW